MSQRSGHEPAEGDFAPPSRRPDIAGDSHLSPDSNHSLPVSAAESASRVFVKHAHADRLDPNPLCEPIPIHDSSLDDSQRDAVCRAVHSRDLLLIQGPPGTGKSRTAVEIIRQSAAAGGRTLLLSPEPHALDVHLLALASTHSVVRRLAENEDADHLSPELAALTKARRRDSIRTKLQTESAAALTEARAHAERIEIQVRRHDELAAMRNAIAADETELAALQARRVKLGDEIQREAESNSEDVAYYVRRLRDAIASHSRRIGAGDSANADLVSTKAEVLSRWKSAELDCRGLQARAEAREQNRWYTLTYWKAPSDASSQFADAQARLTAAKTQLDELTIREQKLASDRRQAEDEFAAERSRMLESEMSRRTAELDEHIAALEAKVAESRLREQSLTKTSPAAEHSQPSWADEREKAHAAVEQAEAQAAEIATRLDELVEEHAQAVAVVAGPIAGIANDPDVAAFAPFSLVVIDDAHRLSEADFHIAASWAEKWVLLGQPCDPPSGKRKGTRPEIFARLAQSLRHDVWIRDGDRLLCRLYPVRGGDRRRLECEPVADAPDIELRLFNPPDGEPKLAEVVFPARIDPAAAREYLFHELGEVTCEPRTRTAHWESTPEGVVARFGPADPESRMAEIAVAVREELLDLETRAIHFSSDWDAEQARDWVAENVARRDPGRFVSLSKPFRNCPGLARWFNNAFSTGFAIPAFQDETPHVEFLAVPDTDNRRRREPQHRPARVGGAGYEIDLSDPRQRAAVPSDFQDLPNAGFVNVPEAQALVRYLEAHPSSGLAITSPFPTQVAVLRKLVGRSARLAKAIVLDADEAARHECDLLAVSLTRSHVARAVTFGETPAILAGLLTRARKKLLLAGDPGTLARRLQWEGPVDHLDAADAARERNWVAALADCPRVSQPRPRPYAEHARS